MHITRWLMISALFLGLTSLGYAEDPPPSQRGLTKGTAVQLQGEQTDAVSRPASGDSTDVWIHNNSGDDVTWVHIKLKGRANIAGRDGFRVTVVNAKIEGQGDPIEVDMFPPDGTAVSGGVTREEVEAHQELQEGPPEVRQDMNTVSFRLDNSLPHCSKLLIVLRVHFRDDVDQEWGTSQRSAHFNLKLAAGLRNNFVKQSKEGAKAEPDDGAFEHNNIDPSPKSVDSQLTPGQFDAPDLAYGEATNCNLQEGFLEFVPLADAAFSLPTTSVAEAFVLDAEGAFIDNPNRVELGPIVIQDGRALVEILYRDPEEPSGIAIVLHNLRMQLPAMSSGQQIGYTVGGTATRGYWTGIAPLAHAGEPFEAEVRLGSAAAEINGGSESYFRLIHRYAPFVVQAPDEYHVTGYVPGIVLEESDPNIIGDGSIEYRPLDSFEILASENTKVFLIYAETGDTAVNAFGTVTLTTMSDGGVRITLANRNSPERLKVVLANIKLDLGEGPFTYSHAARVGIGGNALPGLVDRTAYLAEGAPMGQDQVDPVGLPEDPLAIVNWSGGVTFAD